VTNYENSMTLHRVALGSLQHIINQDKIGA